MKRNYLKMFVITLCFLCIILTGCGKKKEDPKKIEPNQTVGEIKFYVDDDYKIRNDLRGVMYTEDYRKVFAKGDTNDYSTFYYVDMKREGNQNRKVSEYIDSVNTNNLKEADVKFLKFDNEHLEVYAREAYETKSGSIDVVNYAYITEINSDLYTLVIAGPKDNKNDIEELAKKAAYSLQKKD